MNADLQAEIEVLELLQRNCRTLRGNRNRPELAGPAGRWEMQFRARLEEIQKSETPELPLAKAAAA